MITTWEYIKELFAPTDRVCIFMLDRTGKAKPEEATQERFLSALDARSQIWQRVFRMYNARGYDVWVTMNPLRPEARSRTKDDVAAIKRLYLDLDEDGPQSLAKLRESTVLPTPNYVLNTSPEKYQVIWNVQGFSRETAEATLRALVQMFGGDPAVTDISRVLRLPGLHNKKYATTFQVTAERFTTAIYGPDDFRVPSEILTAAQARTPVYRSSHPTARTGGRDTSRSGQDFGYCCQQLWRSTPATIDSIARRLMSEMEDRISTRHPSTPRNHRRYAELTVTKARTKVEAEKALRGFNR